MTQALSELCIALMLYTGQPMTYINVDMAEIKLTIRFTRYGYTIAGTHGVITADSYNAAVGELCNG